MLDILIAVYWWRNQQLNTNMQTLFLTVGYDISGIIDRSYKKLVHFGPFPWVSFSSFRYSKQLEKWHFIVTVLHVTIFNFFLVWFTWNIWCDIPKLISIDLLGWALSTSGSLSLVSYKFLSGHTYQTSLSLFFLHIFWLPVPLWGALSVERLFRKPMTNNLGYSCENVLLNLSNFVVVRLQNEPPKCTCAHCKQVDLALPKWNDLTR